VASENSLHYSSLQVVNGQGTFIGFVYVRMYLCQIQQSI